MSPLLWIRKRRLIIVTLLWLLILACGSLDRLQEINRQRQAPATETAIINEDDHLNITKAYEKLQALPGYRLERQHIIRDNEGNRTKQITISECDVKGNAHILTQNPDGQQSEIYFVDGHTYVFETQYEGWVKSVEISQASQRPGANLGQLLTEIETEPIERGKETLLNRPVTRYTIIDTVEISGNESTGSPIDLRGTLWIDDETGAVVKSEIFFYENEDSQPTQEFILEISEIGNIPPITVPTPIVDPTAIASATATAQVQIVLPANLNYQGEQITFEIAPLRANQAPDSSPRRAEVQLILRQLPDSLYQETDFEPFLAQIRQRLTLSIPERNLIVTSSGFRLEDSDAKNRTLEVVYFFNADLEDFGHVELILSGQGNPLFAPVPVE